jgi:hypothetical protein
MGATRLALIIFLWTSGAALHLFNSDKFYVANIACTQRIGILRTSILLQKFRKYYYTRWKIWSSPMKIMTFIPYLVWWEMHTKFKSEKLKERDLFGCLVVNERIILKWISGNWVRGCGHCPCTSGYVTEMENCQHCNGASGILKIGRHSLPDERLPVYEDGHCSTWLL